MSRFTPGWRSPNKAPHQFRSQKPQKRAMGYLVFQWLRYVLAFFLAAAGAIATFYQLTGGPPWPTPPSFAPGGTSYASQFDVPFVVTNPSSLFSISNLHISCEVSFDAQGTDGGRILTDPESFVSIQGEGLNPELLSHSSATFTCPFRGFAAVDGTDAGARLLRAKIYFIAEYNVAFWGTERMQSQVFQLDTETNPPEWQPGPPLQ